MMLFGTVSEAQSEAQNDDVFFAEQVEPILKAHCFKCHGGDEKIRGGLRLTSRADLLRGGDLGPAVDLEKPDQSRLLGAIKYADL